MKRLVPLVLAFVAVLTAAVRTSATPRGGAAACASTRSIGLLVPLTGSVPFLGREQRNWARLAVARWNARHSKKFRLMEADTSLSPGQAAGQARALAANPRVLGVVGPAGSDEVPAVAPPFARAKLAYVSGSATRASLTKGSNRGFFRVVPSAARQAPTDANFLLSVLRAKRVVAVDESTAYSVPLADAVERFLKAHGVQVTRVSVEPRQTNYTSAIAKIDKRTRAVFLPWQSPARAQRFGEQMQERKKRAPILGTDALFSADFKIGGSYVSMFAPDPRRIPASRGVVRDYNRRYGTDWTVFGVPTYVATQVVMRAIDRACRHGGATRSEVRRAVARTRLATSLVGTRIEFARNGDLRRSRYFVYRLVGRKFKLVQ